MSAPLIVTPGDPAGIGPEVAVKALRKLGVDAVLMGDRAAIERWSGPLPHVDSIGPRRGLSIFEPARRGEPIEVAAIRAAVTACRTGRGRALVTGPIHKERLAAQGVHHRGHTELLGELCGVDRPVMAFVGGRVRVALVTVHVPLSAVAGQLTRQLVLHTLRTAHAALTRQLHLSEPRILVCGVNPHAGDGGVLGWEEAEVIAPACQDARALGMRVEGPMSAETAWRMGVAGQGELVVAMYHDQGLAPLKVLDFGRTVNWTLGLPIVRTSVDHGTADDIAGQGIADSASMEAAIELALQLSG